MTAKIQITFILDRKNFNYFNWWWNNCFQRFDQYIRLWDIRNIKTPVLEHKTDGGVWRIIENKEKIFLGLSFANQFEILEFGLEKSIQSLAKIKEHDSLAYGLDFYENENENYLVTSSFYDKKLCLWKIS